MEMCQHQLCTIYKQATQNDKLKPITTVSVDHVLPKIDLRIEHVLIEHVLIGFKNRSQKSKSIFGVIFA